MTYFEIITESGAGWLVRHSSMAAAERAWEARAEAEPMTNIRRLDLRRAEDREHAEFLRDAGQADPAADPMYPDRP